MALPLAPLTLATDDLVVRCLPEQGFVISSILDVSSGAEAIWMRLRHEPARCARALGPSGEASIETFLDLWPGGWFSMFPAVGYPAASDPTSLLHGELVRLPWEVTRRTPTTVEATVCTLRAPFAVTRSLKVTGSECEIVERIEHRGAEPATYAWGQHPCFARSTFAGGTIELASTQASIPGPLFAPASARLAPTETFAWPLAPGRDGVAVDVSEVPQERDARVDQMLLTASSGLIGISAPRYDRVLELDFEHVQFPYLQIWQNFAADGGWPFWRDADTFSVEWSTNPGRSMEDAVAAEALKWAEPGCVEETSIRVRWRPWSGRAR